MESTEREELNLEKKVTVRSIAPWATGFRRFDNTGDVMIPPKGTVRLSRNEIISQVQNGNTLLNGTDSRGSHATLIVEDRPTRVEIDFESEDGKITQKVLTEDLVKKLFNYKTQKSFEENLKKFVVTRAEKYALVEMIEKLKLNDFNKIRAVEEYTGIRVE